MSGDGRRMLEVLEEIRLKLQRLTYVLTGQANPYSDEIAQEHHETGPVLAGPILGYKDYGAMNITGIPYAVDEVVLEALKEKNALPTSFSCTNYAVDGAVLEALKKTSALPANFNCIDKAGVLGKSNDTYLFGNMSLAEMEVFNNALDPKQIATSLAAKSLMRLTHEYHDSDKQVVTDAAMTLGRLAAAEARDDSIRGFKPGKTTPQGVAGDGRGMLNK